MPRAIRRDVPLTNAIRRAYDAGTRDMTGRPGTNYWQLQTDYAINARLDPATQTITGNETITLHNNSPQPLAEILLRLDHNIYRGLVPRGGSVPAENTEGMVITRLSVNGEAVDLAAPGRRPRRRRRAAVVRVGTGSDAGPARARARRSRPSQRRSSKSRWRTKLPGGPNGRGHRMTQRFDDTLFQPTQWFPRVAKYDDLRGWDTNIYLGPSEFYNNFGRFDVRIDVPAGWIVSGTGVLQNPQEVLTARRPRAADASPRIGRGHHHCRSRRSRSRAVHRRRRSARVAFHGGDGERLRLGHREELRLARDARDDSGQGPGAHPHGPSAGARESLRECRAHHAPRARVLFEALERDGRREVKPLNGR